MHIDRFGKPFPIHDLEDADIQHWLNLYKPEDLERLPRFKFEAERRGLTAQPQ